MLTLCVFASPNLPLSTQNSEVWSKWTTPKHCNSRICTTGNPSCTQTWVLHADRPLALVSRLLRIWGNSSSETSKIGEELVWFPRDQEISRLSFFLSHRSQEEKESCWEVQDRKAHKCTMPPSWKCKIENRTQLSFLDWPKPTHLLSETTPSILFKITCNWPLTYYFKYVTESSDWSLKDWITSSLQPCHPAPQSWLRVQFHRVKGAHGALKCCSHTLRFQSAPEIISIEQIFKLILH